jgi:hypothetical protein
MTSERIKEIQKGTAYPESRSVHQALLQVWNECEQESLEQFPTELEPVLAKIDHQDDLGLSQWYEVVYYNSNKWCSYSDSMTFEDGERVVEWVYCKNQFKK